MEDILIPIIVVPILFIGLPWLIFHYITKWKQAATLTSGDEKLLDELHDAARRRPCPPLRLLYGRDAGQRLLPEENERVR